MFINFEARNNSTLLNKNYFEKHDKTSLGMNSLFGGSIDSVLGNERAS